MNSRERVLAAVEHRTPDRVPIELGSTWNSTLTLALHQELSKHYGGGYEDYRIMRFNDTLVFPDTNLLDILCVDCRSIYNRRGKKRTMQELYDELSLTKTPDGGLALLDENGKVLQFKPSNSEEFQEKDPLLRGSLNPKDADKAFKCNIDKSFRNMVADTTVNAERLRQTTDYALIQSNFIAMPVTQVQQALGFEDWYVALALSEKELMYVTERYLDQRFCEYELYFKELGSFIDITECVGDDMADQRGISFSLDQYRRLYKPLHKKIIDFVKQHTKAKIMFHICGAATAFIPDLIDIGVDIINPVQVNATGMDAAMLKQEYGKDLCFWGGIDTQKILPYGTTAEVREHVLTTVDILGNNGGYIFAPAHDIERGVPVENVIVMYEAVKETF
jgi:uroporphyrinogen decarboxylase